MKINRLNILKVLLFSFAACLYSCQTDTHSEKADSANQLEQSSDPYLNHSDSAKYVGMNTCKLCHQSIYESFIKTGMGQSFGFATKEKSSASFSRNTIYDKFLDLHYRAYFSSDHLYIEEYELEKNDTLHKRTELVDYVIGSGQHTNSHIQNVNGYLNQMPMTYYTQSQKWDFPPGFEDGMNTRFSRKIGLECMSCHNGYPEFVKGSENKYTKVAQGIDCERCHGPGSIHVDKKSKGERIDTSKYIDYSIVNPSKLAIERQFDICQRCHLQGNAVLKNNHSYFDFKPGQTLSDFVSVFLPKYTNSEDEFIMASHVDRLKQSACFIESLKKSGSSNSLKPYKDAMTCITCHDPHVSVKETNTIKFNTACKNCHSQNGNSKIECSDKSFMKLSKDKHISNDDKRISCVNCHMPRSGSIDIPHVTVHDHYIRKPISNKEKDKIKAFIGLIAINEKQPDLRTRINAYLQQYEKFEQKKYYLDTVNLLLSQIKQAEKNSYLDEFVQYYFASEKFDKVIAIVDELGESLCYQNLKTTSFDNKQAWTAYRIGESYSRSGNIKSAIKYLNKAIDLAPYNLEFRNKYATSLAQNGDINSAMKQFEFVLKEHPKNTAALTNLGYLLLISGNSNKAFEYYQKATKLAPEYEQAWMNLSGYYLSKQMNKEALIALKHVLKINTKNKQAQEILNKLTHS